MAEDAIYPGYKIEEKDEEGFPRSYLEDFPQ
jgi:hypothetical protein